MSYPRGELDGLVVALAVWLRPDRTVVVLSLIHCVRDRRLGDRGADEVGEECCLLVFEVAPELLRAWPHYSDAPIRKFRAMRPERSSMRDCDRGHLASQSLSDDLHLRARSEPTGKRARDIN